MSWEANEEEKRAKRKIWRSWKEKKTTRGQVSRVRGHNTSLWRCERRPPHDPRRVVKRFFKASEAGGETLCRRVKWLCTLEFHHRSNGSDPYFLSTRPGNSWEMGLLFACTLVYISPSNHTHARIYAAQATNSRMGNGMKNNIVNW